MGVSIHIYSLDFVSVRMTLSEPKHAGGNTTYYIMNIVGRHLELSPLVLQVCILNHTTDSSRDFIPAAITACLHTA
jgi:hypothetical protein